MVEGGIQGSDALNVFGATRTQFTQSDSLLHCLNRRHKPAYDDFLSCNRSETAFKVRMTFDGTRQQKSVNPKRRIIERGRLQVTLHNAVASRCAGQMCHPKHVQVNRCVRDAVQVQDIRGLR